MYTVIVKKHNEFIKAVSFNEFKAASEYASSKAEKGYDVTMYPTDEK